MPNDKERLEVISSIVNRLKLELNTIDAAIGTKQYYLPPPKYRTIIIINNRYSHFYIDRILETALHSGRSDSNTRLTLTQSKCGDSRENHNQRKP